MKRTVCTPYDAAELLKTDEIIAAYITKAIDSADAKLIDLALSATLRAKGLTKTLRKDRELNLTEAIRLFRAVGLRLVVLPEKKEKRRPKAA